MPSSWAAMVELLLGVYLGLGVLFAVPFLFFGVTRIDPAAATSTRGFRLLVFPGALALWPLLLSRWVRGRTAPVERNAHRDVHRRRT